MKTLSNPQQALKIWAIAFGVVVVLAIAVIHFFHIPFHVN